MREHVATVPAERLAELGALLAERLGRDVLFSTVAEGVRRDDVTDETRADLVDLRAALPDGRLSTVMRDRDEASPEPVWLTMIRQAEAAPPALPAVLLPRSLGEVGALCAEASAGGYAPYAAGRNLGAEGAPRPIGLSFGAASFAERRADGTLDFGAGASWGALVAAAARDGRAVPAATLSDRFASPADAAIAGLLPGAQVTSAYGVAAAVAWRPAAPEIGVVDKCWILPDADAAEAAFEAVTERYRPLYAAVVPSLDAQAMDAAGLWRRGRRVRRGGAGLRVAFAGTPVVRRATLAAASWGIERAGGVCHHRGPLPPDAALSALIVAAGACRVVLNAPPPGLVPQGGLIASRSVAVDGQVRREHVVWYARDLARSLAEAEDLLEPPVRPQPEEALAGEVPSKHDEWDALREALAAAMP